MLFDPEKSDYRKSQAWTSKTRVSNCVKWSNGHWYLSSKCTVALPHNFLFSWVMTLTNRVTYRRKKLEQHMHNSDSKTFIFMWNIHVFTGIAADITLLSKLHTHFDTGNASFFFIKHRFEMVTQKELFHEPNDLHAFPTGCVMCSLWVWIVSQQAMIFVYLSR